MLYGQHINNGGRYRPSEPPTKLTTKQSSAAPGKAPADAVTTAQSTTLCETADSARQVRRSPKTREKRKGVPTAASARSPTPSPPGARNRGQTPKAREGAAAAGTEGTPLYGNRSGPVVWVECAHLTAAACERAARGNDATRGGADATAATQRRRRRRGCRSDGRGRAGRETSRRPRRSHHTRRRGGREPRPTCARHLGGCRCRPRKARGWVAVGWRGGDGGCVLACCVWCAPWGFLWPGGG